MPKDSYKTDKLCISHPGMKTESFPLVGKPAFMPFSDKGTSKLAIEVGTDWIDFEDSELIGGSETLLRIWGLTATSADLKNGLKAPLSPVVKYKKPLGDGVFAWFFGSVGHRVEQVSVEFCGDFRVKIRMLIDDITEETEESNTVLTVDAKLTECNDLECPD